MAKRKKNEALMGRALVALGAFSKIIQLAGSALGASVLGGTVMTLITSCLLVGGLAVLAIERMSHVSAFALISLVGILGGILSSGDYIYSVIFMIISFLGFGATLISMKKKRRIAPAVIIIILTALLVLHLTGVLSLPAPVTVLLLCLIYASFGGGLFA